MKTINPTRGLAVVIVGTIALCAWQYYSTLKASYTARKEAAQEWASTSPERQAFIALYEDECERKAPVERDKTKIINRPLSIKECAIQLANDRALLAKDEAENFGHAMEVAMDRVDVPAPLRWL